MSSLSKIGVCFLSVLVGAVFVFSAFTKLYPIEFFELAFLELNIFSWKQAPFAARIIIGTELFVGFLLILNIRTGKWFYKFIIALLVGFSIHLIIQIWLQGNEGNCGCFGNFFTMTPLEGILKNIVLIAASWVLLKFHQGFKIPYSKLIVSVIIAVGLVLPFILNPVILDASEHMQKEVTGYPLPLKSFYENQEVSTKIDLRKGKWVIAFLSASCPHCRIAGLKLRIIKDKNPDIPVFFVINGKGEKLESFFSETKSEHIPHMFLKGDEFIKISGPSLPAIFMIAEGIVEVKPDYVILDQDYIENWLNQTNN